MSQPVPGEDGIGYVYSEVAMQLVGSRQQFSGLCLKLCRRTPLNSMIFLFYKTHFDVLSSRTLREMSSTASSRSTNTRKRRRSTKKSKNHVDEKDIDDTVEKILNRAVEQLGLKIQHVAESTFKTPVHIAPHSMGWAVGDDAAMQNLPRDFTEEVCETHLLQPHLARNMLQGLIERDGITPDALMSDERLVHMIAHIVREHGLVIVDSPSVQQRHVVEVVDVFFSRPEGKKSRNYVCPMTATEAILTRNSYRVTIQMALRHNVYVPVDGETIESLHPRSAPIGGVVPSARSSYASCTIMPSMEPPEHDVLLDEEDPRQSVSLWSSSAAAGRIRAAVDERYRLVSSKLITNHVLTTFTAMVGGPLCNLSDGPSQDVNDLYELGVKRIVNGQGHVGGIAEGASAE